MKRLLLNKFFNFIALVIIAIQLGVAQPASSKIGGKVMDEEGYPIPYATIFLNHSKLSTCTNNDGRFLLNAPGLPETICVSSMGYFNNNRNITTSNIDQIFILKKKVVDLSDIYVYNVTAAELVKQALAKVPENYDETPFLQHAFYRHTLISKDTLFYVDEFACQVIKSYKPDFKDQYFIQKKRNFRLNHIIRTYNVIGIGGFDFVKSRKQVFDNSFFRNHVITYQTTSLYDNRPVFVLSVKPSRNDKGFNGLLYIDQADLAFVQFKASYPDYTFLTQYKKVDDHYILLTGHSVCVNHHLFNYKNTDVLVSADYIVTQGNLPFFKDSVQGVHVDDDEVITEFSIDNQDTTYWNDFNQLLPDKKIQIAVDSMSSIPVSSVLKRTSSVDSAELTYAPANLLHPQFRIIGSVNMKDNLSVLSQNWNSIDMLAEHAFLNIHWNKYIRAIMPFVYFEFISSPLLESLADYQILRSNGFRTKLNAYNLNDYGFAYNYGLSLTDLNQFRSSNYSDFMRLHTSQYESNYLAGKQLEEQLAFCNVRNPVNLMRFLNYYNYALFIKKYNQLFFYSKKDIKEKAGSEMNQPLIIDKNRSWVHYLFFPTDPFKRHITQSDLTMEETNYLKTSSYFSLLNLLSPQIFGLKKWTIGKNAYTFSMSYLPISYGRFFEQNFWQKSSSGLSSVSFRQYANHETCGIGLGYKRYEDELMKNFHVTSELSWWQQPKNYSFYDDKLQHGMQFSQTFRLNIINDKYLHQKKMALLVGYDYKTKGYVPGILSLNRQLDLTFGLSFNLK